MGTDLALKLAALITALTAITVEDLNTIKANATLGQDVVKNIESLQAASQAIDQSTIDMLNSARVAIGLDPL